MSDGRHTTSAVEGLYERLAPLYDVMYGVGLQHGRRRAMARLDPRAGERILEVGVGTGLSALGYPVGCRVVAIDLSAPMLARARGRLARRRVQHVALCRMDAAHLAFADAEFDAVIASYVINVVPDPLRVAAEMLRVCRPGGRLVLLNHFARTGQSAPLTARMVGSAATRATGVNWGLELDWFLQATGLSARSVEEVNLRISSVVECRKPASPSGTSPSAQEAAHHDVSRGPGRTALG